MFRFAFPKFLMMILFIFGLIVPLSFIIMALWNNILVAVLHVTVINFWQALGIFTLSKILFGGFPGSPGWGRHGRGRDRMESMRNKWMNMTPEEKTNFKNDWRNRCGKSPRTSSAEATATE